MITLKNITKVYATDEIETLALNDINLTIEEGDFIAIMGPSGCGKSTLLNVLGLLDAPTEGSYKFLEKELADSSEKSRGRIRKQNISFIFQNFNLIDELSVAENIELPLRYMRLPAKERKERVQEAMERMGIDHRANHLPQQLSGGQQQRVAIARAVVTKPKVMLADEPTGNLDSKNGEEVMNLLKSLNEAGTTIVMVTHSTHDSGYARKTINLFDGKLVKEKEASLAHA